MAPIRHDDVIENLGKLGLGTHEAQVYMAVLAHGEASAGIILGELDLHREQVYRALKKLVDTGILAYYIKRKRGYYSAVDPSVITSQIKAKLEIAESIEPYLRQLHEKKPHVVQVMEGKEAFAYMLEDVVNTIGHDGELLVMGGAGADFYEATKDSFARYVKQCKKRNITFRMTTYENEDHHTLFDLEQEGELRVIPSSYKVPASTQIYGDKVSIQIFDPENISIIFITNPAIANAYRQTFETTWALGKVVTRS